MRKTRKKRFQSNTGFRLLPMVFFASGPNWLIKKKKLLQLSLANWIFLRKPVKTLLSKKESKETPASIFISISIVAGLPKAVNISHIRALFASVGAANLIGVKAR